MICDGSEKQSFDRPLCVVGWDAPLQKCSRKALSAPHDVISPLPHLTDDFFVQLRRELAIADSGPSAYNKLLSFLHLISTTAEHIWRAEPDGVQRVHSGLQATRLHRTGDGTALQTERRHRNRDRTRRRKSTIPFTDADLIPRPPNGHPSAIQRGTGNVGGFRGACDQQDAAVSGFRFRAISSGGHVTYTSSPPAPTQQARSRGCGTHAQGSSLPLVMHVADNNAVPFCRDESD